MFEGSTDFLSYALVLFLGWVYLPYTFFKFSAEIFIDLGRRRDATQLEEIIAAFLPSVLLNLQAVAIFKICSIYEPARFSIDFAVMAAMFGDKRGSVSVSDYIYAGNWWGPVLYLGFLWTLAIGHGFWFGRLAKRISHKQRALQGIDRISLRHVPDDLPEIVRRAWFVWFSFFRESFVPLFTWRERKPYVRVETKDRFAYIGRLIGYEKTTDGKLEAIRLESARRYPVRHLERFAIRPSVDGETVDGPSASSADGVEDTLYEDTNSFFVIWSEIVEMRLLREKKGK